jgi:hypothetical protein
MVISGDNFHGGRRYGDADYFFSRYHHIWGWASWRRAWHHYDFAMHDWPRLRRQDWLQSVTADPMMRTYWQDNFDAVAAGRIDTWDYQWLFSAWAANGLSITPNVNLVANIGFGPAATHTTDVNKRLLPAVGRLDFPLCHPALVAPCTEADRYEETRIFLRWRTRVKWRLQGLLRGFDR